MKEVASSCSPNYEDKHQFKGIISAEVSSVKMHIESGIKEQIRGIESIIKYQE